MFKKKPIGNSLGLPVHESVEPPKKTVSPISVESKVSTIGTPVGGKTEKRPGPLPRPSIVERSETTYRPSMSEQYAQDSFNELQESLKESIPYKRTQILNRTTETQGEYPEIPFRQLRAYRDNTPQLKKTSEIVTELIVGRDIIINTDDEEAKKICEDFIIDTELHEKVQNVVNMSLTFGYGMFVKVFSKGELANIEDFDITQVYRVHRDEHGNIKSYVYLVENGAEEYIKDIDNYIPLVLNKRQRDPFGYSFFHSLAVPRIVKGRYSKPLIEHIWAIEDAMATMFTNLASPTTYYHFPNLGGEDLQKETSRLSREEPGDKVVVHGELPEVKTIDVGTSSKFDSYVRHIEKTFMLGTGFPYEILTGDFTSRASSNTTENFFMRTIKNYQTTVSKKLQREIFNILLMNHPSKKWDTKEKVMDIDLQVSFDTKPTLNYTPEQAQARYNSGIWTLEEIRQYDKNNGQDLFSKTIKPVNESLDLKKMELSETKRANDIREKTLKALSGVDKL